MCFKPNASIKSVFKARLCARLLSLKWSEWLVSESHQISAFHLPENKIQLWSYEALNGFGPKCLTDLLKHKDLSGPRRRVGVEEVDGVPPVRGRVLLWRTTTNFQETMDKPSVPLTEALYACCCFNPCWHSLQRARWLFFCSSFSSCFYWF